MQALNPFLRAFFASALPSACLPINQHVLLVPTTEVLLNGRDDDMSMPYAEVTKMDDFLASHVLRVPANDDIFTGRVTNSSTTRETKGKVKQYTTINGRIIVVKESSVYSNKGFRSLNQAQLLYDTIYYPDSADGQQWLVYYISKPLVGTYVSTTLESAVISDEPSRKRKKLLTGASAGISSEAAGSSTASKKKVLKNFGDVMTEFPTISRQMQNGLEKLIRAFVSTNDQPMPAPSTRRASLSSQRSVTSLSESVSSIKSSLSGGSIVHPTSLELEPEEESLRTALEAAVTSAIELFQKVDKNQLSLLGANTELTGPMIERMIERYVAEQAHDQILFPRVCAIRKADDSDLDSKIRKMVDIDITHVGILIEDSNGAERRLAARLAKGVEAFKRMGAARSPQEMLEILLNTQKIITAAEEDEIGSNAEKQTPMTINADILVSMLVVVVIRSGVRHLHSRLLYMRYFIYTDEVESGEQGYALATLEAVLAHLSSASSGLREASKRNRLLWQAVKGGDMFAIEAMLQPRILGTEEAARSSSPIPMDQESSDDEVPPADALTGEVDGLPQSQRDASNGDFAAVNGSLQHVFPFERPPTPPPEQAESRPKKRVSLAALPRSHSRSSTFSSRSHSRNKSMDSDLGFGLSNDISIDALARTHDADGNSVLMMAIDAGRPNVLKFLLGMPAHFRTAFVLEDMTNEGTTLFSAAMQTGNREVTDVLATYLEDNASDAELRQYAARQDSQGRSFAHYLFHQPHMIQRFGKKVPWRLKDKNGQTPLFALCRSYDHEEYHSMTHAALSFAQETQGDDAPLHLDDHVDSKGNTLLHIINDMLLALKLLRQCDSDVNAANEKRFTPLMVGSKYGRIDLIRALFSDPRVDLTLRDVRGLSAVDLAKDDEVRNRMDDLVMLACPPANDGRITAIARSVLIDDATTRLVMKSGAPNPNKTITVTTCRRTVSDFEDLANWLSIECPASWLPTQFNLASPFLIPSRPSRAILRDNQIRLDNFLTSLLAHGTFSTHELVWEFFLVPEIDSAMLTERTKRKAEARVENVKDDFQPVTDTQEVENFVEFAREQVKGVTQATRKVIRSTNKLRMLSNDLWEACSLSSNLISKSLFIDPLHRKAFERYAKTLVQSEASPMAGFYYHLHSITSTSSAIQVATNRPAYLIGNMSQAQRAIDRSLGSISRSNRWTPNIGLFEDTKRTVALSAWEKAAKARTELESLGCELRYTQQTIASELAVWQSEHVKFGRAMLRKLAKDSIVKEKATLEGMQRALREIRKPAQLTKADNKRV